jgi:sortase A
MDIPSGTAWPQSGSGAVSVRPAGGRESAPRRALGSAGFLLDSLRRRRAGRMALWTLVAALTIGGVGLLAYPTVTGIWADRIQNGLENEFAALAPNQTGDSYAVAPTHGDPVTRLKIPAINVDVIVVSGVTGNALRAGAGHFPDTALPGDPTGNVAIAGHRTGYGEPFRHLDKLKPGQRIHLATPFGTFVYEIMKPFDGHGNPWITDPTDLTVKGRTAEPTLTLVTCDPPGTSKNRLILRAKLVNRVDGTA